MPKQRISLKGKGADLFFGDYTPDPSPTPSVDEPAAHLADASPGSDENPVEVDAAPLLPLTPASDAPTAEPPPPERQSSRARQPASVLASSSASTLPRSPASTSTPQEADSSIADSELETIALLRRQVRLPGKEVSFTRLTIDEKRRLADIVHHFKQQGQKTSENEINRIAINALLHDYDTRGDASLLARVLAALLA